MKTLGENHAQTAHIHMDMGNFFLKWNKRDEALSHFEQAYLIFEKCVKRIQRQHESEDPRSTAIIGGRR